MPLSSTAAAAHEPPPVVAAPEGPVAERAPRALAGSVPEEVAKHVLVGRIVDENGALIGEPEPIVRLRGPTGQLVATVTDGSGAWRIGGLEAGTWEVRGSAEKHLDACMRIEVGPEAPAEPLELWLSASADLLVRLDPPYGASFSHETLRMVLGSLRVHWRGSIASACAGIQGRKKDGSIARPTGTLLDDGSFGLAARMARARSHAGWVELVLGETVLDRAPAAPGLNEIHLVLDVELAREALARLQAQRLVSIPVQGVNPGSVRVVEVDKIHLEPPR